MNLLGLQTIDWIVLVLYLALMIMIGLWARRRVRTTSDFYQGGALVRSLAYHLLELRQHDRCRAGSRCHP